MFQTFAGKKKEKEGVTSRIRGVEGSTCQHEEAERKILKASRDVGLERSTSDVSGESSSLSQR